MFFSFTLYYELPVLPSIATFPFPPFPMQLLSTPGAFQVFTLIQNSENRFLGSYWAVAAEVRIVQLWHRSI